MKLLSNIINGYKYLKWSKTETLCYFLRGVSREINMGLPYFENLLKKSKRYSMMKFYNKEKCFFDFNGTRIPDISSDKEKMDVLRHIFEDVLLIDCYYNGNYNRDFVEKIDEMMVEGPYGYVDGTFDVRVKKGDVVIDAGAWIGDFSAYAASKGAISYAFEPTGDTYLWLCKTRDINKGYGEIIPIKYGLGDIDEEREINICELNSGSNSLAAETFSLERNTIYSNQYEMVKITRLDSFVESIGLKRIDFIKSDIEGFERNLLRGAVNILKTMAPKLAICTYHYPDDPEVLEKIILDANPNYKVIHLKHKLFASV